MTEWAEKNTLQCEVVKIELASRTDEQRAKNKERCKKFYENNKERVRRYSRMWYAENKDRALETKKKYANSPRGRAIALFNRIKRQSENRRFGRPGFSFGITVEWIENKIVAGACEATGIPFDLAERKGKWNPFSPSVDRVDSSKAYTMDNCRVVCLIFNMAHNQFSDEDVLKMARGVIEKNGK